MKESWKKNPLSNAFYFVLCLALIIAVTPFFLLILALEYIATLARGLKRKLVKT